MEEKSTFQAITAHEEKKKEERTKERTMGMEKERWKGGREQIKRKEISKEGIQRRKYSRKTTKG